VTVVRTRKTYSDCVTRYVTRMGINGEVKLRRTSKLQFMWKIAIKMVVCVCVYEMGP